MQVTGTQQAFLKMLEEKNIHVKLGVAQPTAANWKRILVTGDTSNGRVSIDKMEEMLLKAGASVVVEKVWDLPGATALTGEELTLK